MALNLKANDKKENDTLLRLKKGDIRDLTLLDIKYRLISPFPFIGDNVPFLIELSKIKYLDTRQNLDMKGEITYEVHSLLLEQGITSIINSLFDLIVWDVIDFSEYEYYNYYYKLLVKKHTLKLGKQEIINQLELDKDLEKLKQEVIYNFKDLITARVMIDTEIEQELHKIFSEITKTKAKILSEFQDIVNELMNYEDNKSINFNTSFTVMLKTSIINNPTPIFPENVGKAFTDYSFREVVLRMAFENKETMLNNNKMNLMLPVMAKSSI